MEKANFCSYFFCAAAFCAAAILAPQSADAALADVPPVQFVDFYPNGAKFTFRVDARKGKAFDFTLPGAFDSESLRCLTRGAVTSLKAESFAVKATPAPELEPLRKKRAEAEHAVRLLEAQEAALNQTLSWLPHNPFPEANEGNDGSSNTMLWGPAWLDYVSNSQKVRLNTDTEMVDVRDGLAKARDNLREAQEDFNALSLQLEHRRAYNSQTALRVSGTSELSTELLFEAHTPAAGWRIEHEMDMNNDTGNIEVRMSALAHQNTGLDVEGEFAFHTRRPTSSVMPPDIPPQPVTLRSFSVQQRRSPASSSKMVGGAEVREEMYQMADSAAIPGSAPAPQDAMMDYGYAEDEIENENGVEAVSTLASVTVKGRGRIDNGRAMNRVTLGEFVMNSAPVLISIPEQNREAWLVASIDAVPDMLLPGLARLAVDGLESGQTFVPESAAGRMNLPFGMSDRLTSKKTPFIGRTESSWLSSRGTLNDGYTIEITSALAAEREVTVRDRLPLPTTDKISLESLKIEPAPTEHDKENRLLWKFNIRPGETKKITVEYTLRYPADDTLEYGTSSLLNRGDRY